ncbi:hypothetical protein RJ55_08027 [Drechmeria coniospora]|nr:hypothetical protein RJ55_08027 [Drechmeria coniospora]
MKEAEARQNTQRTGVGDRVSAVDATPHRITSAATPARRRSRQPVEGKRPAAGTVTQASGSSVTEGFGPPSITVSQTVANMWHAQQHVQVLGQPPPKHHHRCRRAFDTRSRRNNLPRCRHHGHPNKSPHRHDVGFRHERPRGTVLGWLGLEAGTKPPSDVDDRSVSQAPWPGRWATPPFSRRHVRSHPRHVLWHADAPNRLNQTTASRRGKFDSTPPPPDGGLTMEHDGSLLPPSDAGGWAAVQQADEPSSIPRLRRSRPTVD